MIWTSFEEGGGKNALKNHEKHIFHEKFGFWDIFFYVFGALCNIPDRSSDFELVNNQTQILTSLKTGLNNNLGYCCIMYLRMTRMWGIS